MTVVDFNTGKLLRAVAGSKCQGHGGEIAELAAKVASWNDTVVSARRHGVLPMLYSVLAANPACVSPLVLEMARREFERNAFHCIANAAELLEVLRVFEEAEIAAMPFKGVVLATSAYGDMTARTAGDLDLLIHDRDLLRASKLLIQRGYELITKVREDGIPEIENSFECHFERAADGKVLELRWRLELTQPRYTFNLGMDWAWPRRTTIKLAGEIVPNLDPVSTLLMLCMHGSKHVWSRLVWICDVAALIESQPGLDWDLTCKEAKRVGLWRCLALGVLLARRVAGVEVPAKVLQRFEADRGARRLAEFFDKQVIDDPGGMPRGRIPYNIKILGFRDRAGVVLSATFLQPNARDRAVVKLPKLLEPLYYLIRPFRFLVDRGSR